MKASRRNFLGFLGGAATAGPAVAKQAIAAMPVGMGELNLSALPDARNMFSSEGSACQTVSTGKDWRFDEIARLKRWISGDIDESERQDRERRMMGDRHSMISQHVAGLVSVSPARKVDIYTKQLRRSQQEIDRINAQSYLGRLLKEIGQ